jgi:excinuclease UvrABC nuclease subunit
MSRILIEDISHEIKSIPMTIGYFIFFCDELPLFIKSTENLQRFIAFYTEKGSDDTALIEMLNLTTTIMYFETETLVESLLIELICLQATQTRGNTNSTYPSSMEYFRYNSIIKPWYGYTYLSANFTNPPYLKITDDTTTDGYFIGPFRSSFVLNDTLDVFAELFKMPRCSSSYFPCERLVELSCLGFCQNQLIEALPEMINRMMMLPNKDLIQKLTQQHADLLDSLQFQKADNLSTQISILKKYYKYILFVYVSQFLDGKFEIRDFIFFVTDGLIVDIVRTSKQDTYSKNLNNLININVDEYYCLTKPSLSQRSSNELLAYEKAELDHRWIVFNFVYDTKPEILEKLFLENIKEIQSKIFH